MDFSSREEEGEKKIHTVSKLQPFSCDKIRKNFSIFQAEDILGPIEM